MSQPNEQRQALLYARDFLRGLIRDGEASVEPERLYLNVSRALGDDRKDDAILSELNYPRQAVKASNAVSI